MQGSSTSTDPLMLPGNPLFPAILLAESNTTWSRSPPHFQHYTDYLERQPAAPTQALCLEPTTVFRLASRSRNRSLHVSALPSRGLLPHLEDCCHTPDHLQTVSRKGQDKWAYILTAPGQKCILVAAPLFFHDSYRTSKKSTQTKASQTP